MESIRPNKSDQTPLRAPAPPMGTIILRLAGLLAIGIVVMALVWRR